MSDTPPPPRRAPLLIEDDDPALAGPAPSPEETPPWDAPQGEDPSAARAFD